MNPLDWTGPAYLAVYVPLLAVAFLVARKLGRPSKPAGDLLWLGKSLDPYEVALLKGNYAFRDAVAASLIHRGVFRLEEDKLIPSESPPSDLKPLEKNVLRAAKGAPMWLPSLSGILVEEMPRIQEQLVRKGLMVDEDQARELRRTPLFVFGAMLAVGFLKLLVGLMRDRPVGILFAVLILGAVGWMSLLKVKLGRTPAGDRALELLKQEHAALRTTLSSEGSVPTLSGAEVALAVALFGTTALATTQLAPLRQRLQPPLASSTSAGSSGGVDDVGMDVGDYGGSDSGGSDSGGGDSGGSDSGGGSSCGGGGCGGCGGGGGD